MCESHHSKDKMADSRDNLPDQVTMAMVNHYLTTTGIEDVFKDLCHNLLKSPRLPYNPYPGLVRQLRAYAERWVTWPSCDHHIMQFYHNIRIFIQLNLIIHAAQVSWERKWVQSHTRLRFQPDALIILCYTTSLNNIGFNILNSFVVWFKNVVFDCFLHW